MTNTHRRVAEQEVNRGDGDPKAMENAAARRNRASENFILAMQRLSEFFRDGKVPEHL